ncbi:DUF2798 domain-containing protein [Sharpea azabuensis]|uniref:DUF2798 domain-containing protein n=1 Tax=Sharpea azabuensis TaxID=322505 RepID=UPI0008EC5D9F|nr:DUF2798 domain-containing protein [Sharpea azabuensis]HAJ16002.1 DUF2798 domain-containing protein [Erysipelotrichaceae bacterium]MDD6513206.1 DUF2798 domain-containing protein [Sharpea azabuensis]MEE3307695.1 DUF2798 domain-containing protein [Sharpea azabuensis]SFD66135.1 hypothetical protein SAMN04487836_10543 [Sharpea azabuensis]SFK64793.1 hypothetical protein SAMN04487835_10566 [Sharpea azabuensis]
MPKTKFQNIVFALMMTFIMVYAMICYNIALNIGGMTNEVFIMALGELKLMWPIAFVLEVFVLERAVIYLFERLIDDHMPLLWMILIRSSLTVCLMCPTMSFVATLLFKDYAQAGMIGTWLQVSALNFPMALAWQIFFGGPLVRWIFRLIFERKSNVVLECE